MLADAEQSYINGSLVWVSKLPCTTHLLLVGCQHHQQWDTLINNKA